MHYLDKKEALVKIMGKLVEAGWEVFGYSPDQSDAMTDYYCPASWSGIASKNGFVLVIDNNSTHYSGYEVKQYNYNKTSYKATDRIVKLEAMMNDPASTDNEKASCAVLIDKEKEKQDIAPTYTIEETYPTFAHGNPKSANWHIEKDGQIIAKGNGAFAVNTYDWENEEVSAAEQKAIKLAKFIAKIEKVLTDSDALQAEVIKVAKTVTKPVEKADNEINEGDIISFTYHGGFWLVNSVYTTNGQIRISYESVGSAKRGYQRVRNAKRYYQTLDAINKQIAEGKAKVYTLEEVTEYVEKTVFKKTTRKQPKASEAVQIKTTEETTTEQTNKEQQKEESKAEVTVKMNEEFNGVEIYFSDIPSQEIREQLKSNGFRWSKRGFWYAKQTDKALTYANSLQTVETHTEPQEQQTEAETAQSNVIYHDFKNEYPEETESMNTNTYDFEDIFSKFENIDITAEQQTSTEDVTFCKEQEELYKHLVKAHESLIPQLQEVHALVAKLGHYSTAYTYSLKPSDIEQTIAKMKDKFISSVCHYFMNKYNVTIDYERIQKKYDQEVTHEDIISEITEQLGGYNFHEKAEQEIKQKLSESFAWKKAETKGKKIALNGFLYIDTSWKKWGDEKIHYNSNDKLNRLLIALLHFENGSLTLSEQLETLYRQLTSSKNEQVFTVHELNFNKVQSIKIFKNGKVEIEFSSSQQADLFRKVYCVPNVA